MEATKVGYWDPPISTSEQRDECGCDLAQLFDGSLSTYVCVQGALCLSPIAINN